MPSAGLAGVRPSFGEMRRIEPAEGGRFLNERDEVERRRVVFLGDRVKKDTVRRRARRRADARDQRDPVHRHRHDAARSSRTATTTARTTTRSSSPPRSPQASLGHPRIRATSSSSSAEGANGKDVIEADQRGPGADPSLRSGRRGSPHVLGRRRDAGDVHDDLPRLQGLPLHSRSVHPRGRRRSGSRTP